MNILQTQFHFLYLLSIDFSNYRISFSCSWFPFFVSRRSCCHSTRSIRSSMSSGAIYERSGNKESRGNEIAHRANKFALIDTWNSGVGRGGWWKLSLHFTSSIISSSVPKGDEIAARSEGVN